MLDLVEPGNHWAAQHLAGLFWPRFMEVDGYVLVADHFEPDTSPSSASSAPTAGRPSRISSTTSTSWRSPDPRQARGGGQACRHITQAWRDALDTTFPGRELTVDWDPQERIVTAYSRA